MMSFFFSDETRRNPFPWYDQVRSVSPVFHEPSTDQFVLFDYDSVKRALTDHESFSSVVTRPDTGPGRWLIFSDPPRHTRLRALIMRAFTPRAVAGLEPRIGALADMLLDRHLGRGQMDLVGDFAVPLPLMVIAELLGAPAEDWPRFRRWSDAIMGLIHTVSGSPEAVHAVGMFVAAHGEMQAYLAPLIETRRPQPRDDLLSRLVEAEVDGDRLSDEDMLGFFQLLLLAGHETTTNLIDNAVLSLIEHPAQCSLLRDMPEIIPAAIEEVLRYRTPVQAAFRVATRDVELHGQRIAAGKLVLAMIGSANRDPTQFARPEQFDVRRNPNPHIAFGHGIHFCVGAPLARLEGRIALARLLTRLETIALASDEPWEPRQAFHVHGPSRLPIRFTPAAARQ